MTVSRRPIGRGFRFVLTTLSGLFCLAALGWHYFNQTGVLFYFRASLVLFGLFSIFWWWFPYTPIRPLFQGVVTACLMGLPGFVFTWKVAAAAMTAFQEILLVVGERRFKLWPLITGLFVYLAALGFLLHNEFSPGNIILTLFLVITAFMMGMILGTLHLRLLRVTEQVESLRRSAAELAEANVKLQDYSATQEALAIAQERNRMAREIHDTLGYTLTPILVKLEFLDDLIRQDPERAVVEVETIRKAASEGLRDVRASVNALRGATPDEIVGKARWMRLIETFHEVTGVQVETKIEEDFSDLPQEIDHAIYRAIQEALTNAYRHGHAQKVLVEVWWEDDLLLLMLSDNGCGMAPDVKTEFGFGLKGIQERVTALGGSMATRSWPGRGFDLGVQIPYKRGGDSHRTDSGSDR